jgi:hypothetical protein
MDTTIGPAQASNNFFSFTQTKRTETTQLSAVISGDRIEIGLNSVSVEETIRVVTEKSLDKLLAVVNDARAELGIPVGEQLDTSPEATAGRIADFALNFFSRFEENHPELEGEDARQAFSDLIGGAIQQGIQEARDILQALNALDGGTNTLIDNISQIINERLELFVTGG